MSTSPTLGASSKLFRRLVLSTVVLALAGGGLAACGSDKHAPKTSVAVGKVPAYYPSGYDRVISASKKEGGELDIYSNTDQVNWDPIFRDFSRKYPWVKTIKANNLDSDEVFQRILSEEATGGSEADIAVTNAAQAWADFLKKPGEVMDYKSAEDSKVPDFAKPAPNVYAFSADPVTLSYNSDLIGDQPPTGFKSLADLVSKDPGKFKNKITTRAVDGSFGFTVTYGLMNARPDLWSSMAKILPLARPNDSSGDQLDKIESGEYVAGFLISGAVAYPAEEDSEGLLKPIYPDDGTPVLPRGIAILSKAKHPATAKLFLDFVLSQEGQQATAEGGLTSWREGITSGYGIHTYQELVDKVGEDNIIHIGYDGVAQSDVDAFVAKWNGYMKK